MEKEKKKDEKSKRKIKQEEEEQTKIQLNSDIRQLSFFAIFVGCLNKN